MMTVTRRNKMSNDFPFYTTDYFSGVMSLRKPQTQSLKILEEIANAVQLRKGMNLKAALGAVHAMYPICSDFERDFMSLTFALATGVGKTRLMGAFIAYLYTQHHIRNFFVVAPNTTIFEKLKKDLSDNNSAKYVFKGLGCFSTPPQIITDDDYREKTLSLFESDVHIFVYNIDKFNKISRNRLFFCNPIAIPDIFQCQLFPFSYIKNAFAAIIGNSIALAVNNDICSDKLVYPVSFRNADILIKSNTFVSARQRRGKLRTAANLCRPRRTYRQTSHNH